MKVANALKKRKEGNESRLRTDKADEKKRN